MKSTFSIIFYLKRQVVKKDGTVPVMGRITVDGTQAQFSCKTTANPDLWDTKGGRMIGKSMQALEVNGYSAHVYDMEVIIAIALQMDTYQALLFRQWFISKVVNRKDCQAEQVKHEYPMIIVMNGTMPRGAS